MFTHDRLLNTMNNIIQLTRINRPTGGFLLLWPSMWGLWLAFLDNNSVLPLTSRIEYCCIFIFGTFLMRSAGCIINDFFDRDFDKYVLRTKYRPITSGKIKPIHAIYLFLTLVTIAGLMVYFYLKITTLYMAIFGLILTIIYPLLKRWTNFPQIGLGVAFAWSIPMAYIEVNGTLPINCWIMCVTTIAWVIMYDTQYAIMDKDCDTKIGIKSTAIFFSQNVNVFILFLQCIFIFGIIIIGILKNTSIYYYLNILIIITLFSYQNYLIKTKCRKNYFKAFKNNNLLGLLFFIMLINF